MNKTKLPVIFSIAGALGVIATGALASFATVKAVKLLEGENKQLKDISLDKETIQKSWKSYILPGSVAFASIVSILIAQGINRRLLVTFASALIPIAESYREYRDLVVEKNPELDKEIVAEMAKDHYISPWGDDMGEKVTFYDPISDRVFERCWYEFKDAMYKFNRNFQLRGYAYLNELYSFLDLDMCDEGDIYGFYHDWFWENGICPWIDYGITTQETKDGVINNLYFVWPVLDLNGVDENGFPTIHDSSYFVART